MYFFLYCVKYKIDIKYNILLSITLLKMTESTNESMSTQSECTICLLQYTDETKKATECQHIFHQECIDRWLQENNSCPLCRTCLQQHTRSTIDEEDPNTNYDYGFSGGYGSGRGGSLMQLVAYGASDRMLTSMDEMDLSIERIGDIDITLPSETQHSRIDNVTLAFEFDNRPDNRPSNSYRYGGLMALAANGASDIMLTPTTTRPRHTQSRREQHHQPIRNQIKHNNIRQNVKQQNKRR